MPGATNEAALAFVDAWPQWPSRVCALWGREGSGKTHLAQIWRVQARCDRASRPDARRVAELPPGGAFLLDDADAVEGGAALFHLIQLRQSDVRMVV